MSDCVLRDAHCWHEAPIYYMGTDEPFEAVCCHCGSTHSAVSKPAIPLGHGPHYPVPVVDLLDVFNPVASRGRDTTAGEP